MRFSTFSVRNAEKEIYDEIKDEIAALRNRGKELWSQAQDCYGTGSIDAQITAMNATAWAAEELYRLTEAFDRLYRGKKEEKKLLDIRTAM